MRLGAILNKIYWKIKLAGGVLKKRWKAKLSYGRLLKNEMKKRYVDVECLIIDWRIDGGAVNYLCEQLKNKEDIPQNSMAVKSYDPIIGYVIELIQDQKRIEYIIPSYQDLKNFLSRLYIRKIYVNEMFGYDNVYEMLNLFMELKKRKECQLVYLIHDYYCICPIFLWGGMKTAEYCVLQFDCIKCKRDADCYKNEEIQENLAGWQEHWETFLKKCDTVIAFSQVIKARILQIYSELPIQVVLCQGVNRLKKVDAFKKMEKGKDGVSVCIPAYNNAEYVKRLLTSLQIQTYHNYEVVITDDSSGREVEKVVAEYKASMPIRYYRNCSRLGPTRNNNQAICLAERKYIKIMHHDDWFARPDSLEQFVFLLEEHKEVDLAFSGNIGFGKGKSSYEYIKRNQAYQLAKDCRNLFFGNWIGAPSVTIFRNKEWLFDENLVWLVDCELYMRILKKNPWFAYTELPLIFVGTSDTQLTKTCQKNKKLVFDERKYVYQKFELKNNFRFWKSHMVETFKYNFNLSEYK